MIEIKGLRKVFPGDVQALKKVDFTINEGELVCLLGPSGCGKTTILNLIAGLLDPTDGDILVNGESIINKHPKDRNVGLVFQNYALYPHMSVLENIMFPLRVGKNKLSKAAAKERAFEYMAITSIEELADKKPTALSGGQQQRVAITRALVQNPKILLLDEPLSNLDARLRLRIRDEIRRLVKEINITTIFVTHDQEEALSISDKIILMDQGIIQQEDIPQHLYLEPANLFVSQFMGNPIINTIPVLYKDGALHHDAFTLETGKLTPERFKEPLEESANYLIGLRPEDVLINDQGLFEADLRQTELIGRDCILDLQVNDLNLKSVVDVSTDLRPDQRVTLDFDYPKLFLFKTDGSRVY